MRLDELTGPAAEAARAFRDGGGLPGPLPDEVADALVEALAERGDAARLSELAASADKALAKRARRGLHKLRARGVKAEIPLSGTLRPAVVTEEDVVESLASAVIRDGERLLWYVRPAEGGLEVCQAHLHERDGLTKFEVALPTRREWRQAEQEILADQLLMVGRIESAHARWLLEEAYQAALDAGRAPPRRYAEVRHLLPRAEAPAEHPALALAGEPPSSGLERVLELPETSTWIPDEDVARSAYLEVEQVATSQIVVDEQQRREQVRAVLLRRAAEALAGPWRARLARRLLETAYLIARRAKRGPYGRDVAADAALCVAAARNAADAALPVEQSVVGRGLFERLIPKELAPAAARPPGGGLIVTP